MLPPALPGVRAIATIGPPLDPAHGTHLLDDAREAIEKDGVAWVNLVGRPFRIKRRFLADLDNTDMDKTLAGLNRALLVLHSPDRVDWTPRRR